MRWALPAVLAMLLALTGCMAPSVAATPWPSYGPPTAAPVAAVPPAAVTIPGIDATSGLVGVGLDPDGEMLVPDTAAQAAWYDLGVPPGQLGPAVIVGHIDLRGRPGVFARLDEVGNGDEVLVDLVDGRRLRFVVYRTRQFPKNTFPWDEVVADTAGPELRLISCQGPYDPATLHYADNLVAYARLAASAAGPTAAAATTARPGR